MCYKVSWIITNGIEWKSIHSFLSVFLMHRNIKKFAKIWTEKFLFCRKRKKIAIKAKRKKFYDDEEMEAEIKVPGRSMENEKINQQSLLACF